jgi:hypothetical protein
MQLAFPSICSLEFCCVFFSGSVSTKFIMVLHLPTSAAESHECIFMPKNKNTLAFKNDNIFIKASPASKIKIWI